MSPNLCSDVEVAVAQRGEDVVYRMPVQGERGGRSVGVGALYRFALAGLKGHECLPFGFQNSAEFVPNRRQF